MATFVATPAASAIAVGSVDVGYSSTCAVMADTTVQCWGTSMSGQLGDGVDDDAIIVSTPTTVPGVVGGQQVSVGEEHACARLSDATITCWGLNNDGQVQPSTAGPAIELPQTVAGVSDVAKVIAAPYRTCVILDDATVSCWGANSDGQVGVDPGIADPVTTPTPVAGISDVVDLDGNYDHTCALESDGDVWCWGANGEGELGDGTNTDSHVPVLAGISAPAIDISTGDQFTCAVLTTGGIECWGTNGDGQLGDGTTDEHIDPAPVIGLGGLAVEVAAGQGATCARLDTGSAECWGETESGRLGNGVGDESDQLTPDAVTGLTGASHIVANSFHFCAITAADGLVCWGDGRGGQLGVDTPVSVPRAQLADSGDFEQVAVGPDFTCARTAGGLVECAGENRYGQLGNGTNTRADAFGAVSGVTDAADIDAGRRHVCIARSDTDATAACWGDGGSGRLGNGSSADQTTSVPVSALTDVTEVTTGDDFSCALTDDGADEEFWCWGRGADGQIGNNSNTNTNDTPQLVSGITDGKRISAGDDHACGIVSAGAIRCWGDNGDMKLGDGTTTDSNVPVVASPGTAANQVSASDRHTCVRAAGSTVWCWGADFDGRLGNGPGTDAGPTMMVGVGSATNPANNVAAGVSHTCVLLTDETVACTGSGTRGRLGDGTTTNRDQVVDGTNAALRVVDESGAILTGIISLDAWNHTCAVRKAAAGGGLFCWGDNEFGAWGDPPFRTEPTAVPLAQTVGATTTTTTTTTTTPTTTPATTTTTTTTSTTTTIPDTATTTTTPPIPPAPSALIVPVSPARLVETRVGSALTTVDGKQQGIGRQAAGAALTVNIAGRANVPADASAAVVNITAIRPGGIGYVTSHPCLTPAPTTSSLNFSPGVSLGNEVIVQLDSTGNACLFTSAATDIAVDIVAYLPAGSIYSPVAPARLADTRSAPAGETVDGTVLGDGTRVAGSNSEIPVAGRAGVPTTATAAVINVTAIRATGIGYFTVHPCQATPPNAASLNYTAGANRGNEIIAPLSATGSICIFTSAATDLAVDIVGFVSGTAYSPVSPTRLLETRSGNTLTTADGKFQGDGKRAAGQELTLDIAGRVGIPANAKTVTVNLTAIAAENIGYATVHPCLPTPPNAASLNFVPGVNGGNEIIAQIDANGRICIFTSANVHLTADIAGYTT